MYVFTCSNDHKSYSASKEQKESSCPTCGGPTQLVDEDVQEKLVPVGGVVSDEASVYARFYNDETSRNWSPDPEINALFITTMRNFCNDRLKAHGFLFLNEVYEQLGLSRTRQGQLVGWIYVDNNSGVDFGEFEGKDGTILLDFNVDGIIIDKIEE